MINLRLYSMNFEYNDDGSMRGVIVFFGSVGIGENNLNGNVFLTMEEFSMGDTLSKVKAKVVELLTDEPEEAA